MPRHTHSHRTHLHSSYLPVSEDGVAYLWFESLVGDEGVNDLFEYRLILKTKDALGRPAHGIHGLEGYVSLEAYQDSLTADSGNTSVSYHSPASHLDVKSLIGTPLGFSLELNDVNPLDSRTITGAVQKHGLIASITQLTTHNLHATYEIMLVPWLWLLTKTNNYRIYQNQSVPYILDDVLSHYPYAYELTLSDNYPALDYQTQYDESDYTFITRLMAEHGLNFYFEHTKDNHTLIITDSNHHFKAHTNPFYQDLTLYPPTQRIPDYAEYLEHFHPTQSLVMGQSLVADYQFKSPSTALMAHDSRPWDTTHNQLQRYEWAQGRRVDKMGLDSLSQHLAQSYHQQGLRAYGQGQLKGLQVGRSFCLHNHPSQDNNIDWLILSTQTTIKAIDTDNRAHQYYTADTSFIAQPLTQALKPEHIPKRPIARIQTATVVAPVGEEIHTDSYGRVKVKFHWDMPSYKDRQILDNRLSNETTGNHTTGNHTTNTEAGNAGSEAHINTCWLRVASGFVGSHYGSIHLPRVGQEVIVDFFGGNPDMPFVAGSLSNPEQMPPWELPNEKVLSGIKSKEYQGAGANQLVMDDSTGKLQVQLKSDHLTSELNLGHITRISPVSGRGEHRGEGFELRSDGWGTLRSAKGLILTTHGRQEGEGYVKDVGEVVERLETMINQHSLLLEQAIDALCELRPLDKTVIHDLKRQLDHVTGASGHHDDEDDERHPEVMTPQIILSSQSDMIATAKEDMHLATEGSFGVTVSKDISMATMGNYSLSSSKAMRLFSHRGGVKLYANQDDIELQAQGGDMTHIAKQDIKILSTQSAIDLVAPKQIRLRCEGAQLLMNKDGITLTTDGSFKVRANHHDLQSGQAVGVDLMGLPVVELFNEKFQIFSPSGTPMSFVDYQLSSKDKSLLSSTTDTGETKEVHTPKAEDLSLELAWMTLEPVSEEDEVQNTTQGDNSAK